MFSAGGVRCFPVETDGAREPFRAEQILLSHLLVPAQHRKLVHSSQETTKKRKEKNKKNTKQAPVWLQREANNFMEVL